MRPFVALAVAVTSGLVLFPLWALALGDVARTGGLRLSLGALDRAARQLRRAT